MYGILAKIMGIYGYTIQSVAERRARHRARPMANKLTQNRIGFSFLVERGGGDTEQHRTDMIALAALVLAGTAQRHQRLCQMKCGAGMQPDDLAEIGQAYAVPSAGDFPQDCHGPADRKIPGRRLFLRR